LLRTTPLHDEEKRVIFKVRVFISWSGESTTSHGVAKALHGWIQNVLHVAEPFMSSDDILPGERWNDILGRELDASGFGILCITRESLNSPWMLFEAGALAGGYKNTRRVCPYLLDLPRGDLKPPLSQFNAVSADRDGTFKMLQSLNSTADGPLVPEEILRRSFKVWWDELDTALSKLRSS
jgi:TIR domain